MQVFKAMMKVTRKRLPSAMVYIIVFVVISILVTNASTKDNKFEITKLDICVFDEDDTPESRALIEFLGKSNDMVEIENDRDKIIDALYYKRINYALIINKGYAERLAAGDTADLFGSYHIDENYSVVFMGQFLDEYITSVKAYLTMGMTFDEAIKNTEEALSQSTEVDMLRVDKGGDSHFSVDFAGYFQYMPYILIAAVFIVVCQVLVTMNKKDIRYRTNCSCMQSSKYTFQLFFGSGLFVIAVWLLLIVIGAVLNKEMYTGRAWYAVLNSFIFSVVVASMAVFVSSFEPKENVLNLITQALSLGMSFLCGIFIPMEVLSDGVLSVARFLPAYWYVKANNMIADIEPFSRSSVLTCYLVEFGFAVMLIILTLLVRKVKYSGAAIATTAKKAAVSN
ncbi:ABC transporter permease [Ruminococcus flavefaciens]|uniref:ABC transporter permease n=1 Tax=Ruminococcus flavefaciens TaxID=1265 RepID=UPI000464192D|nr:ABC transporter permease [Ruminococcus flavefaciens]